MANDLKSTLKRLEKETISMKSRASEITDNIRRLNREMESLKLTVLQKCVEHLKQNAAREDLRRER